MFGIKKTWFTENLGINKKNTNELFTFWFLVLIIGMMASLLLAGMMVVSLGAFIVFNYLTKNNFIFTLDNIISLTGILAGFTSVLAYLYKKDDKKP